jgi:GNAT superfamily N-acetyltransferase
MEFVDVSRDVVAVREVHAFLLPHFGEVELEALSYYEDEAQGSGPVETIIVASWDAEGVCAAAIGSLIPLSDDRVLGAVGHALVDQRLRGKGAGRLLNTFLEERVAHYAVQQGLSLEAFVLESEAEARFFWGRVGYRWPVGCRYRQPPLRYTAAGVPDLPSIPLLFMLRHPDHDTEISGTLAREYLRAMMECWFSDVLDEELSGEGLIQARAWLERTEIAPAEASLVGETVMLRDPSAMSEEELAPWLTPG